SRAGGSAGLAGAWRRAVRRSAAIWPVGRTAAPPDHRVARSESYVPAPDQVRADYDHCAAAGVLARNWCRGSERKLANSWRVIPCWRRVPLPPIMRLVTISDPRIHL